MPTLTIINDGTVIETSAAVSILNALLRNGTDIQHRCGGKAVCGTCRVRIVDGAKFLSPMRDRENTRLQAVKAPRDFRLACQTFTFGDVTIEIPSWSTEGSGNNRQGDR